jgi:hypothetical protein
MPPPHNSDVLGRAQAPVGATPKRILGDLPQVARRPRSPVHYILAQGGMAAALVAASLFVLMALAPLAAPSVRLVPASVARLGSLDNEDCNAIGATAVSSLYVTQGEPHQNLSAGGTLKAYLEYQIENYSSRDASIRLYFPSTFFTFPMATGGNFSFAVGPGFVNVTGPGWQSPAFLAKSETPSSGIDFVSGGTARLSSQKLAIMATVSYGVMTVEFRWRWTMREPGMGHLITHAWSTPSNKSGKKGNLPSIFFPAPYVSYLGGTGASAYIGSNYTSELGGDVAGRLFFLEMEYGGGSVVQDQGQTAPANATTFYVSIPILNYDGWLKPATMLVHIHDVCGALLYNKVVKVTFAPTANITFFISPASCGSITFNGTRFANTTTGTFVPSQTVFPFSIPACKGHSFSGWQTTGGLHIESSKSMLVSANGTFSVTYH